MQYVGMFSQLHGTPEACPGCGRDMLFWGFGPTPACRPNDGNAMCWGPRGSEVVG